MTTMPTSAPTGNPTHRPPAGGGSASNMVAIDPIKLLKKYKWVLAASLIVGGILGVIGHFLLLAVYPTYTANVIFYVSPIQQDMGTIYAEGYRQEELEQFMATQRARMLSDLVLQQVVNDPRLTAEAPKWSKQFMSGGRVNTNDAEEALADITHASTISGTSYMQLSVKWRTASDATALAKLVREAYLQDLNRDTSVQAANQQQVVDDTIRGIEQEIADLNDQRARLLKEDTVDSLDIRSAALGQQQAIALQKLGEVQQYITQLNSRLGDMERMRSSEAGITYSDTQRAAANQDPIVMNLRQQLKTLETQLQSMREAGIMPAQHQYQRVQAQIDSTTQKLSDLMEETLARNFDAEYDQYKRDLMGYQAQQQSLSKDAELLRTQLADLNATLASIQDLDRRIQELIASEQNQKQVLSNLTQQTKLSTAARVTVYQQERKPTQVSFPKIYIMVPAGIFLFAGLVGGVLLLREVFDQRVKGPSDVSLLPRARVLGMIPACEEDPGTNHGIETIFRDAPSSVISEHIRQLRTTVMKQMQRHGHHSLVCVGGMPGSGATSIVANLGLACAAMEMRVLVVDGNFRRPAQHKIFELADAPGLADVLAGLSAIEQSVQHVPGVARLDVLTVGSSEHRVYERLGGKQMAEFLTEAREKYDLVLIDVAPAMVSGDGLAVANRADASMLIVRAMGEKRGMVARLRTELDESRAELLGVLVNAVRSAAGGYMRQNIRASRAYHTPGMKVGSSVDRDAPAK